jgi:cobalt transporter subunit CbtB
MRMQTIASQSGIESHAGSRAALVPAMFAALLGALLIWGVGFSPVEVVHNAAHDSRHSTGFPCH